MIFGKVIPPHAHTVSPAVGKRCLVCGIVLGVMLVSSMRCGCVRAALNGGTKGVQ